jgi:hypothetical protein
MPLFERLNAHVTAAERLHGDDTTVPVLASGKTVSPAPGSMCAMNGRAGTRPGQHRPTPGKLAG